MIIVAVVVFDRYDNIVRLLDAWEKSDKGAEMVVLHNWNGDGRIKEECRKHGVQYIKTENVGFDIGRLQDVCRGRLKGFPDWDRMIWMTDDTLIMQKDFVQRFISKFNGHTTPCMEISREVTPHIRTTGFMIDKATASKLTFPADTITTKAECYHFEHRGGRQTMFHQLNRLGKRPLMISTLPNSPLWDIGNKRHLRMNRWVEFDREFSGKVQGDKIVVLCLIYNSYPQIISSLICQTHQNWELILIHDGKNETGLKKIVDDTGDKRITLIETEKRMNNYGHHWRQWGLNELKEGRLSDADYVIISNSDNYYTPIAFEYLLKGIKTSPNYVAAFSAKMVHSYRAWDTQDCRIERGWIDCGSVLIKRDIACDVGWRDTESHSADWFFFQDIINKYGKHTWAKVAGTLFIHN